MTQYHYDRPPSAAVESIKDTGDTHQTVKPADLRALSERIADQDRELRELRQTLRKLQNELRSAVNTFNLRRNG